MTDVLSGADLGARREGVRPTVVKLEPQPHQDTLEHIAEVSHNARATWFALMGFAVFCAVTLMAHRDQDFFAYGAGARLPVIGVEVPPELLFLGAPIAALALFVYLQLYLVKLWQALAAAPEVVEGRDVVARDLDQAVFPWLLTDAALRWRSKRFRRPFGWLAGLSSWALGWALTPGLIAAFWIRSMPYHDEGLTLFLGVLTWVSLLIAWRSRGLARRLMTGRPASPSLGRRLLNWLVALALLPPVAAISWSATEAGLWPGDGVAAIPNECSQQTFGDGLDCLLADFRRNGDAALLVPADLAGAALSRSDAGYPPREDALAAFRQEFSARQEEENGLTWRSMLETEEGGWLGALHRAFEIRRGAQRLRLAKRDLSGADLRRADLRDAMLDGARLSGARLQGADLRRARLEGAELDNAALEGADLSFVRAEAAVFDWSRIDGGRLRQARLDGARFVGASLAGAALEGARLDDANLANARMASASLGEATLERANLSATNLSGADLNNANLFLAALINTSLRGASLASARLQEGALTQRQIDGAFGDAATTLSPGRERPSHWSGEALDWASHGGIWAAWKAERGLE